MEELVCRLNLWGMELLKYKQQQGFQPNMAHKIPVIHQSDTWPWMVECAYNVDFASVLSIYLDVRNTG